jgi:hypothetical protein
MDLSSEATLITLSLRCLVFTHEISEVALFASRDMLTGKDETFIQLQNLGRDDYFGVQSSITVWRCLRPKLLWNNQDRIPAINFYQY